MKSKRVQSATKMIIANLHKNDNSWWCTCAATSDSLGETIIRIALGADRYDLFNALCSGVRPGIMEYARADCRRRKGGIIDPLLAVIISAMVVYTLMLIDAL